jgi:hypothetical protein
LGAFLCASPYPTQAQADPTILARQAELAATAQIVRATNDAAARERARIAAEAAADAARERANAQATAIVLNAQGTAMAGQATATAAYEQKVTAIAIEQATGTAQATGTQIAGTATQVAATETAAPVRTAEALAFNATAQAQANENLTRNVRLGYWVVGIGLLMGTGAAALVLMWRYAMSIRAVKPAVVEVARADETANEPLRDDADADAEGANVTGDPRFASVVIDNILDQMREAAQ